MSTKSTILLTEKEHWYHDMTDDLVYIEIHKDSYLPYKYDEVDGVMSMAIRMDSELGKTLKKLTSLPMSVRTGDKSS